MKHLNVGKYAPLAIAVVFILTGDYVSFFTHVKTIV